MFQRWASLSHTVDVTVVWNTARSYRSYFSADCLAVGEDLGALRLVPGGDVVHLVEQRQIVVGDHVARHSRIPIPVPGATDVGAALDDADALDTLFA